MESRVEVWTLGAGRAAEVPAGVLVRKCATRDFGRVVRREMDPRPEAAPRGAWGWIRQDGAPPLERVLEAWSGAVVDLELATWPGAFTAADARRIVEAGASGVTSHGYSVPRHSEGLRVLAEAGLVAYPQIYRPSRPTLTAAKFAQVAMRDWGRDGFAPERVCPLVAASDRAYALEVGASALREGAAGVGLWGWTSSPSRSTRDLLTRLHRLAYPT